jgi:hypothetical protein
LLTTSCYDDENVLRSMVPTRKMLQPLGRSKVHCASSGCRGPPVWQRVPNSRSGICRPNSYTGDKTHSPCTGNVLTGSYGGSGDVVVRADSAAHRAAEAITSGAVDGVLPHAIVGVLAAHAVAQGVGAAVAALLDARDLILEAPLVLVAALTAAVLLARRAAHHNITPSVLRQLTGRAWHGTHQCSQSQLKRACHTATSDFWLPLSMVAEWDVGSGGTGCSMDSPAGAVVRVREQVQGAVRGALCAAGACVAATSPQCQPYGD